MPGMLSPKRVFQAVTKTKLKVKPNIKLKQEENTLQETPCKKKRRDNFNHGVNFILSSLLLLPYIYRSNAISPKFSYFRSVDVWLMGSLGTLHQRRNPF